MIGIGTGLLGVVLAVTPLGSAFEKTVGLPWLFKVRGPVAPPPEVVVVAIDGSTGRALELPKLPRDWPRSVHAQLIDGLVAHDTSVIVFDMDFSRAKSGYEDQVFARAVADADRVVLFERLVGRKQQVERLDGSPGGWTWVEERLPPVQPLARAAKGRGPFPLPKLGSTATQFWAFKSSAGDVPTTVAIALQLYALPVYEPWLAVLEQAGAPGLDDLPARAFEIRRTDDLWHLMDTFRAAFEADPQLEDRVRQVIEESTTLLEDAGTRRLIMALASLYGGPPSRYLNLYGPPGTVRTVPYHDLIENGRDPGQDMAELAGKVAFVGYSDLYEADQPDRFYTVFTGSDGIDLSGVEIMATAFANLLGDRALQPIGLPATGAILLVFGLVVGSGVYLLPATIAVPLAFAVAGLYGGGAQWSFNQAELWFPVATPVLVQLPLALLLGLMGQYLLERRHGQRMSEAISYYLPANVVKDLTEGNLDQESVNKVVYGTCFANDMSGFSTIAETKSPKELATFMNAYFDALAQALKRHQVDVTEFHADTIMCAWTAAEPQVSIRRDAVLAAIDAVRAIEAFAAQQGGLELNPRIGLQDGYFYLGHTGGGGRMSYSILGDTANTAARLESLNKHLGTHILAARSVVEDLDEVLVRPLGSFRLMGRADATALAEVLALERDASDDQQHLCELFAQALDSFRAGAWAQAAERFETVVETFAQDGPARFYLARCRAYLASPPVDEDPTVVRMDAK